MAWVDPSAPWIDEDPATPLTAARFEGSLDSLGAYVDDETARALVVEATKAQGITPTAVKSGAYTAAPGDYIPVNISGGSVAIALPSAPADKTRIGLKVIAISGTPGSTTLTINRGGSDVFNVAAGNTSLTLSAKFQGVVLQYQASAGIWYVQTTDTPLNEALGGALLGTDGTVGGPSGSALSPSVVSGSPTGGVPAWVKETTYALNTLVSFAGTKYICIEAHKSGATFSGVGAHWAIVSSPAVSPQVRLGIINTSEPSAAHTEEANGQLVPRRVDDYIIYRSFATTIAFTNDKLYAESVGARLCINWQTAVNAQGSGSDGTLGNVATGILDNYLKASAENLVAYGKPVLLRLDWEFNGNWMIYGNTHETAASYIEGWKYIHDYFVAHGVTNVKWCWCPNVWNLGVAGVVDPTPFYPGDAYVDFIGFDGYQTKTAVVRTPAELFGPSVAATPAISSTKPLMINEVGVATDERLNKSNWLTELGLYAVNFAGINLWTRPLSEAQGNCELAGAEWEAFKAAINTIYVPPPTPNLVLTPTLGAADLGNLKGISYDPTINSVAARVMVAGTILCTKVKGIPHAQVKHLIYNVSAKAEGTVTNVYWAFFNSKGKRLATTATIPAAITSLGKHEQEVPEFQIPSDGIVIVAFLGGAMSTHVVEFTGTPNVGVGGDYGQDGSKGYPFFTYGTLASETAIPEELILNSTNCKYGTAPANGKMLLALAP